MKRQQQRHQWLSDYFTHANFTIEPASEDASFRSYYRVKSSSKSYILMDAPPAHEDCKPFIKVLNLLYKHQVNVPQIFAQDLSTGFLLLSDFGDELYLSQLNQSTATTLYQDAINTIHQIQTIDAQELIPAYDAKLLNHEMVLFKDWFIGEHLGLELTDNQSQILTKTFNLLLENALEQPQVMVHRDYHSRNLMITQENAPGVIDFQDAVFGPITYDLASLLKDCYISWSDELIESLCHYFIKGSSQLADVDDNQFMRWFDFMAAQRHLKAIGIFCRLNYRDGKPGYLNDIPRTMNYLLNTASKYPDLAEFSQLLNQINPKIVTAL